MTTKVLTGIARLRSEPKLAAKYQGNIGILCHSASVDTDYKHTLEVIIEVFGERVTKVFGPQHGFVSDVQDNMIETDHFTHPFFNLPIYSLYSETRIPTDEMLEGLNYLFVDLQDVGTRVYTYVYTLTHLLEKCAGSNIEIIILDRPNPINGIHIEGNILDVNFASFVGRHPMPVRHGLTIGEVALMHQAFWTTAKANVSIIEMKNYQRSMCFSETGLPYINPSPNLPTLDGCYTFAGTVLFEGCNISEGRGTTRPLEQIGHPHLRPWELLNHFKSLFSKLNLKGFEIRPVNFYPMFQKHADKTCGGFFIHITDKKLFRPWRVSQVFFKEFKQILGDSFSYKIDGYEYGGDLHPMDMINGTDRIRNWYDSDEGYDFLDKIEAEGMSEYKRNRQEILIYK